ncbi:unnamed protein product [Nezara viridula]|uniref:Uncharacterized protein n=1 Tax=Nezara viridula TaxID=85310 RepID=A0A9P0HDB1_NEZVI|nr:unnamed protein product [Nezara viridula]
MKGQGPLRPGDPSTSASWWRQELAPGQSSFPVDDESDFFSASHGLVQTHPLGPGFGPTVVDTNPSKYAPASSLDFDRRGLEELQRNPLLSSPEECARACREGEPPKVCYYHFTAELYTVLGAYV